MSTKTSGSSLSTRPYLSPRSVAKADFLPRRSPAKADGPRPRFRPPELSDANRRYPKLSEAKKMSPLKNHFLPYQSLWVLDNSGLKIIEKSRQVGITYADAYDSVIKASADGARLDVWFSSRDHAQAKLYLEDCKYWAHFLHIVAHDLRELVLSRENNLSAY